MIMCVDVKCKPVQSSALGYWKKGEQYELFFSVCCINCVYLVLIYHYKIQVIHNCFVNLGLSIN